MSDLLPTKEQEKAAEEVCNRQCDTGDDVVYAADLADVALLLAEREEALRVVICRLRACLHEALFDEERQQWMTADTYDAGYKALIETVQYEVVE